jgi:hypothetical protein
MATVSRLTRSLRASSRMGGSRLPAERSRESICSRICCAIWR